MDGLALLCNLFTDGPVTLGRLRAAHIAHLGALEHADPRALAEILHASLPQARAFAEEARRLARRLAEGMPATARPRSAAERAGRAERGPAQAPPPTPSVAREASPSPAKEEHAAATEELPTLSLRPRGVPLAPGVLPGLDEALCTRLLRNHVRTVQALGELAGLSLARRTGIPYSTLMEMARLARRQGRAPKPAPAAPRRDVPERTLTPFDSTRRAPSEAELAPTEVFTAPSRDPGPAGPFV